MAWASKYSYEFTSRKGEVFTVRIEDESGAPNTVLTPSTIQHTVIQWSANEDDEFSPFAPSEALIQFHDTIAKAVQSDVLRATARSHRIHILRNGSTYWKGYLKPDEITEPEDWFTNGSISAVDGIGLLENEPYGYLNGDTFTLYEGRETILSVIVDILSRLSLGLDIHVSMNWFPEGVTTNNNPLAHIYVDRAVFREKGNEKEPDRPISCFAVLEQILKRFGLQLCQQEGAWKIVQVPLKRSGLYTVWKYSAAGSPLGTVSSSPRTVTAADEETVRSEALQGGRRAYDAVQVDYVHGAVGSLIQNPGFDIKKETRVTYIESPGSPGNYERIEEEVTWAPGWDRKGRAYYFVVSEGDFGVSLPAITIEPIPQTGTKVPAPEDLPGPVDYVEQEGIELAVGSDNRVTYTSDAYLQLKYDPLIPNFKPPLRAYLKPYWVKDQVQLRGSTQTYYLNPNGSWTLTPAWLITKITPEQWHHIRLDSDPLPIDGKVYVKIGPVYEEKTYTSSEWGPSNWEVFAHGVMRDNVRIWPVFADGTVDAEATKTICYVSRKSPSVREVQLAIGDGPTKAHTSYLSLSDGSFTRNWGVGGSNNYTLDELLSYVMLKAMRQVRRTHEATYFDLSDPLEYTDTLIRSGSSYAAYSLTRDLQGASTSGLWVRCRDDSFVPDYDVSRSVQKAGWFSGVGEGSALIALQQNTAFFGPFARHIGMTTGVIQAGVQSQIPIAEMDEALIDAGDLVLIVDPNLEVYQVRCAADQNAGDLVLQIEDPDVPGRGFNFPKAVPYPAYLYITESKLLSIARFGERGFRLSVEGGPIAILDETIEATTKSSLTIKDLVVRLRQGDKLFIKHQSGAKDTAFYLTDDAQRGATSLAIDDGAGAPVMITAEIGDAIYAEGQATRTELSILNGKIDLLVSASRKPSDPIAALAEDLLPDVEYSVLPVLWLKYDLEAGDIIGITDDGDNLVSFVVTDFTPADTEPLIIPIAPITLLEKISAGREFFYPASEMQSGLRIRPDSASLFSETGIVTQAIMDTVDQIGELAVMHTQTQTLQLKDPLQCDLPGGTTIRIRIRQVINDPRGWRDVDPQYLTVVSRTVAAAGAFKGDTTIPITAGITAQPGSLVYYPMGIVAERVGTAEATIEAHTGRLDELSAEVVLKAKVSDGVVDKLAAIELQSSIDEAPSVVLRAAHQADAIAELDESIEDDTRTLLSIKPLRAPCAQGTRLNLITLDGVIPITVREAIIAGTVLPIESQYISKARPGDVIRPDLAYMMAELAIRPNKIQGRVESAQNSLAEVTIQVSEAEASIESIAEILSKNGIKGTTNITQRVSIIEGDVEDIQSEIVLKATVSNGIVTKVAAVELAASVTQGSAIKFGADVIEIAGTMQSGKSMSSQNFVSGESGWQIRGDGGAEFKNIDARGKFVSAGPTHTSELGAGVLSIKQNNDAQERGTAISSAGLLIGYWAGTQVLLNRDIGLVMNSGGETIRLERTTGNGTFSGVLKAGGSNVVLHEGNISSYLGTGLAWNPATKKIYLT